MSSATNPPADLLPSLQGKRRVLRRELARVERAIAVTQEQLNQLKEELDAAAQSETQAA